MVRPPAIPSTAEPRNYLLSRWLFLRLLGVVYLIAFASLAVQITGLVGEHGIMPAGQFLEWARSIYGTEAYRLLPTVFWLGSSDVALTLVSWAGVGLALLLVLGVAPLATLALLWLLYLSLSVAGQDFLSFQWDVLLLETGLLALLWAPAQWLPRRSEPSPSPLARWLLVFLLFKLMFLSGITKLASGDPTWRAATALDYHFETQPLPPVTAWYAHHFSSGVHRAATLIMFLIELGAPFLLFAPARLRLLRVPGCVAIILFQLGIAATGNYGFFNLLTIVLCVPVLDDALLGRFLPIGLTADREQSRPQRLVVATVAPVLLVLSFLSLAREIAYTLPRAHGLGYLPRWSEQIMEWVAPVRSINGYGLFRVMTTKRPELVIEGSRDGATWTEYEFRYKPGSVTRRPGFVAPFHPRLDWQMWFAGLDPAGNYQWLQSLARHLRAGTPEVLALLRENPFVDAPPRFVRLVLYDYRFSTPEERRRTGAWWVREVD
ncbi:MAG TPA: lipase maturation factor family protein [Gemmatimonadales bacterium]|nr:lipase maturation factor family protein [Gemmatimonadales bacterium]